MPPLRLPTLIAAGCVWLMLISLGGCAGDSDGKKGALPGAADAKNYTGPKPKKENLPDLPQGAGKIDEDAPDELTPTKSGLYYRILRKSKGRRPGPGDSVLVHYRGTLDNGKQFDSSYDRGEPTPLDLNRVIAGWTEGIQLVGEGGMIELEVKASLGYGATQNGSIPPNSRLHFIIELLKIEDRS
jgi:FKBP-type peptidyl-prolyl cis-trans isomerase